MTYCFERLASSAAEEYRVFADLCPHAVAQHRLGWLHAIEALGEDEAFHLVCRDEAGRIVGALPAFRFRGPYGSILLSSPQAGGYGGIAYAANVDIPSVFEGLLGAFVKIAEETGCCAATICTPPFQEHNRRHYRTFLNPEYELENFYQYTELTEEFVEHFMPKIRNHVQRAKKSGLIIDFSQSEKAFRDWYALHERRMEELGAPKIPFKLLDSAHAKEGLSFMAYVRDHATGKLAAGVFCLRHGSLMDVFSMIADSDYFKNGAVSLLMTETIARVFSQGVRLVNWQSSPSRDSGVYSFKAGWNAAEGKHFYMSRITGDLRPLLDAPLEEVKRAYRGHFVLPYAALRQAEGAAPFQK